MTMNLPRPARAADMLLLTTLTVVACLIAGTEATVWAGFVWLLYALPGLALFGDRHASLAQLAPASIAGIAISLLAVTLAGLGAGKLPLFALIAVPATLTLVALFLRRHHAANEAPASAWEIAAPMTALLLSALPLYFVGLEFDGAHHFHAFFNADFFKHIAHSEELARGVFPPRSPFSADQGIHYYWGAYLLPSTVIRLSGFAVDASAALLAVTLLQTATLGLLAFNLCRKLGGGEILPAVMASLLSVLSPSLDGLTALLDWWLQPAGIANLLVNQEALDFTQFWHPPAALAGSTWQRLCLYLPQHQLAMLLFLAWATWFVSRTAVPKYSGGWQGIPLLLILPMSSVFVGGLAASVIVLAEMLHARRRINALLWCGLYVMSVLLLFPAGIINIDASVHMTDPFLGTANPAPAPLMARAAWWPLQLLTTFGLPFLLGVSGIVIAFRRLGWRDTRTQLPMLVAATSLAAYLGAELLSASHLRVEVELKASFLLSAGLMMGSALLLAKPPDGAAWRWLRAASLVLLVGGLISPAYDLVWHSSFGRGDIVAVPDEDMRALRWIRHHTPSEAVFQQPPNQPYLLGGKDAWVAIFGARRVAVAGRAGNITAARRQAAALLHDPAASREARDTAAKQLRVDYLYVSRALSGADFDSLAAALTGEGRKVVYRSGNVLVVALTDLSGSNFPQS